MRNEQNTPFDHQMTQWLDAASRGDQAAFAFLLRNHWNKVYTQAITYLKSSAHAQEITQDVFIKIWENREKLAAVKNFSDYLFIISRNSLISALRKKKENTVSLSDEVEAFIIRPDQQLQYKESFITIQRLIDQLPPTRKKVFIMSRFDGKSYHEIAALLGISRNAVKDHIIKALNYLRTAIGLNGDKLLALTIIATNLLNQVLQVSGISCMS